MVTTNERGRRETTTGDLTTQQQALLRLFQHVGHGRVERIEVRGGQPVVDAAVRWSRVVKVHGGQQPPLPAGPYVPRREALAFLRHLEVLGNGEVRNVVVIAGLPDRFELVESYAA